MPSSDYVRLMFERFDLGDTPNYAEENDFLWLLNAPEQYGVEEDMLEYAEKYPEADMRELLAFFDAIAPDGLAPGDDGLDLMD